MRSWRILTRLRVLISLPSVAGYVAILALLLIPRPGFTLQAASDVKALPPQPLGVNDLIAVTIFNAEELSLKVRVDREGVIRLPMLASPIPAIGKLPVELERLIHDAYVAAGILVNPTVTVAVVEFSSKPVSVIGAVRTPVTFNADQPVTLLEALTRAGGLTDEAGSYLLLSRRSREEGELLTQRIAVSDVLESAAALENVRLRGGEEIRVPEAGKIYVVGNLKKPGTYRIPNDHQTSILKALALSEGMLPNATSEAYIYRERPDGTKIEIPVDLKKILARRSPDVTLMHNDVLYVPESGKKKATFSAIDKAIAFGTATLSGVLVWGVAR
ncbi:MAG: SLBB domain-containing protein [Bryobacterales bacterium]|nr:SLBB domain-containing protein [Bryobacterales bacterium]